MGLHLFFLPNFPVATFIPDSKVPRFISDRDSDTEIFVVSIKSFYTLESFRNNGHIPTTTTGSMKSGIRP